MWWWVRTLHLEMRWEMGRMDMRQGKANQMSEEAKLACVIQELLTSCPLLFLEFSPTFGEVLWKIPCA